MFRSSLIVILIAAAGAGTAMVAWKGTAESNAAAPVVYVCRETGDVFLGETQVVPQIHPDTQRGTLFPGLYCPQCQTWKPAPPIDRLHRQPEMLNCPACQTPRSFEGEIPEDAQHL